ncbi:MAG TPA: DegT/DnrJ/EryC1/StrS family aminotransferase [Candidatus Eisenbacteria bacterium]
MVRIREQFLPFSAPLLGQAEAEGVLECLRSGWLTTGAQVLKLEQDFAAYVGCRHALAVSSCTAALHLALEAVGVRAGAEVITSPMTFASTAAVVEHLGARPVFVDCEPGTLNLDVSRVEERITGKTKAILPVHFAGQACDMDPLLELARGRRLAVVEDAAHALPTRYRARLVGTIGDLTCFSFYATKSMTTGEGGMVATEHDPYAERIALMRLHGMSRDAWKRYAEGGSWSYEIRAAGFKYNLSDVAAAIGIPQLQSCGRFHQRRREIARRYTESLGALEGVGVPSVEDESAHAWHLYVIQLDLARLRIGRDEFIREMTARKIGVSVHFMPLHLQPYYRDRYGYRPDDFPNAWGAFQKIVSLPIYAGMSDRDVTDVIAAVQDVVATHRR